MSLDLAILVVSILCYMLISLLLDIIFLKNRKYTIFLLSPPGVLFYFLIIILFIWLYPDFFDIRKYTFLTFICILVFFYHQIKEQRKE